MSGTANANSSLKKFLNGTTNNGTKGKAVVGELYGHLHETSSSKNTMNQDGTLMRLGQAWAATVVKAEYSNSNYKFSLYVVDTDNFELHEIKVGAQYNITDNQYYNETTRIFSYPFAHNKTEVPTDTFKFYHISDPHAETASLDECESLMNVNNDIAFTILTGDYVKGGVYGYNISTHEFNSSSNKAISDKLKTLGSTFDSRFLMINGNHDVWDAFGGNAPTSTASYYAADYLHTIMGNNVMWDTVTSHQLSSKNRPNISPSYWYSDYDITSKPGSKLRVIGIEQYEYRNNHGLIQWNTMVTQNQVDWIISTISALNPQDYFIIAQHTPPVDENRDTCTRSRRINNFCSANISVWSTSPTNASLLPLIVDAYKNCKSINQTVYNSKYQN